MREDVESGSNVFVRNPQRFIPDCVSITGDIMSITDSASGSWGIMSGYVAKMGGGYSIDVAFLIKELGVRLGTPISKISTQPGSTGYSEWIRISNSWGYD